MVRLARVSWFNLERKRKRSSSLCWCTSGFSRRSGTLAITPFVLLEERVDVDALQETPSLLLCFPGSASRCVCMSFSTSILRDHRYILKYNATATSWYLGKGVSQRTGVLFTSCVLVKLLRGVVYLLGPLSILLYPVVCSAHKNNNTTTQTKPKPRRDSFVAVTVPSTTSSTRNPSRWRRFWRRTTSCKRSRASTSSSSTCEKKKTEGSLFSSGAPQIIFLGF